MTAPGRLLRIVGCPGAGKTTELAAQARKHAAHYGPANIIAVSLTRTAAAEIGGRDTGIPAENCATLHAHARRAIEEHDGRPPVLAETTASLREFGEAYPQYAGQHGSGEDGTFVGGLHADVAAQRARMTEFSSWTEAERDYWRAWSTFKGETGRTDYTDWIKRCIVDEIPPAGNPRVMLLDEGQDFSKLELALAVQWAQSMDLAIFAGDTQQALFTWRGSDPDVLDGLDYAGVKVLDQSYRCPRAVADIARAWVEQLDTRAVDWRPRDTDGSVDLASFALRDTSDVIMATQGWTDAIDPGSPQATEDETTMVLASCRYMLAPLCAELRAQGVPFHNPWRAEEKTWNPLSRAGARALRALLRPRRDVWGGASRMWTWGDLEEWTALMLAATLARGARDVIETLVLTDRFGESRRDEIVPAIQLCTLLGEEMVDALADPEPDPGGQRIVGWWAGKLTAAGHKQTTYARTVLARRGPAALHDAKSAEKTGYSPPTLTIGTIHSTKGSEADHVILAPDLSKEAYWGRGGWLEGGPGKDAAVRMMYVGLTRARGRLTILEPGQTEAAPIDALVRFGRV